MQHNERLGHTRHPVLKATVFFSSKPGIYAVQPALGKLWSGSTQGWDLLPISELVVKSLGVRTEFRGAESEMEGWNPEQTRGGSRGLRMVTLEDFE